MKRDLKLNMGQLAETQQNISDYKTKLENLRAACEMFQKVLQNQTSVGYQTLSEELQDGIIRNIQEMETRMDALQALLSGYITDMKGYVAPQSENEMMRVDRNDIWYNLRQIHGAVDIVSYGFGTPFRSDPDYKYAYIGDDSVDEDYIQSEISAESSRRQNNFKKLDAFRTYCMGTGYRPLGDAVDALWKIYNDNIKTFENTDDDYAWQAALYYDRWSTEWNRMQDLGKGLYDIGRGVVDALTGMVDGLISLVAVLLFNDLCQDVFGIEVPDCINERVQGMEEGIALMLRDPQAALEAMGQGLMDTYDEEGICYGIGNAIPDIVIEVVALKGSGTFMQRTVRAADIAGDTAEAARAARIIEAMTLAPDAAEGFADMAWLMNATEDAASGARLMNAAEDIASGARLMNATENMVGDENSLDISGSSRTTEGGFGGHYRPYTQEMRRYIIPPKDGYEAYLERVYIEIRKTGLDDIETIARNTGLSEQDLIKLKEHIFLQTHEISYDGRPLEELYFQADSEIAHAWQRAREGNLSASEKEWFQQLLNHELTESAYMEQGMVYRDPVTYDPQWGYLENPTLNAHDRANLTARQPGTYPGYNPGKELLDHVDDDIVY